MDHAFYLWYLSISRWVLPALSLILIVLWLVGYRKQTPQKRTLARLVTRMGECYTVTVAEGLIGRKKQSDITIPKSWIAKKHALLAQEDTRWILSPLQGQVFINEKPITAPTPVKHGDVIALGEEEYIFESYFPQGEDLSSVTPSRGGGLLLILTLFQGIMAGQLCLRFSQDLPALLPLSFLALMLGQWLYFFLGTSPEKGGMLWETPVLYLTTLGFGVCACSVPENLGKQLFCALLGVVGSILLTLLLKRPHLCYALRIPFGIGCAGILWATVAFGTRIFGSTNWLSIGGFSFQPAEFAKIAFLLVGSCCVTVVYQSPANRWFFLAVAAATMLALVCMVDFGAIAIFFVTMMILLMMRQTNRILVASIGGGAVVAGTLALALFPHIATRFSAWLHVWEYAASSGYQQTRTLIAMASGGMLGVGGGNGTLLSVSAADTDLVFGVLCEEWGQLIGLCAALCFIALTIIALRLAKTASTAFHAMGVCGAAGMMLFQTALNIFGSTDLLPLTGVTMIFVSRGGTSFIGAFLLTAFFKAAQDPPHPLSPLAERRHSQ